MGGGASKEKTFGLSKEDHLLYSPKLLDLDHGTIRHRDKELVTGEDVRQGYFYHAQLTDWSDDNCIKDFQKTRVVEGSKREADKKVFYVYAKGLDSDVVDEGIRREKPKPKGLGYRWRGDSEHKYYRLRFSKRRDDEDSESENEEIHGFDTVYRIHPKENMVAEDLSTILSFKLLIPASRIHIIYKTQKLERSTEMIALSTHIDKSKIELKIITDVEIVKNDYDKDEPAPDLPAPVAPPAGVDIPGKEVTHEVEEQECDSEVKEQERAEEIERDHGEEVEYDGEEIDRGFEELEGELQEIERELEDREHDGEELEREEEELERDVEEAMHEDIAPNEEKAMHEGEDVTRDEKEEACEEGDVTREGGDVTREGEEEAREGEDLTREGEKVTREGEDLTREGEKVTRKEENEVTPEAEREEIAPKEEQIAHESSEEMKQTAD